MVPVGIGMFLQSLVCIAGAFGISALGYQLPKKQAFRESFTVTRQMMGGSQRYVEPEKVLATLRMVGYAGMGFGMLLFAVGIVQMFRAFTI